MSTALVAENRPTLSAGALAIPADGALMTWRALMATAALDACEVRTTNGRTSRSNTRSSRRRP
jgi:hypothetical protein